MYMHFSHEEAVTSNYSISNHIIGIPTKQLHFTVGYLHVCKRIRNYVFSRRKGKEKPRLLIKREQTITWESWENAYAWDSNTNICRLYHRLIYQHVSSLPADKMRNKLAEDV